MFEEDELFGVVYEDQNDGRYYWHCKICSTSFSSSDYFEVEKSADAHEETHR